MSRTDAKTGLDSSAPPFDQFKHIQLLAKNRRGHVSVENARHQLYVGTDRKNEASVLIKVASHPGLTYQENLANEIASLTRINQSLPQSPYFPVVKEHGKLRDGRLYLILSFFDELPLAMAIGDERIPGRTVNYLKIAMEVAKALDELHSIRIYHVDLNPMNILLRLQHGGAIVRIVDFESSYDRERHAQGDFYNPPTTPGYSAPELSRQPPDARTDVFSLGAVLYTMLAGYGWTWKAEVGSAISADRDLDEQLKELLLHAVDADPGSRCGSIAEFRSGLESYLEWLWRQWH
jgi:serine/threonine protein kinase